MVFFVVQGTYAGQFVMEVREGLFVVLNLNLMLSLSPHTHTHTHTHTRTHTHTQGFLNIKWAKWKRVLLTRSIAIVPCVIIAILARNSLDYLDDYINVEQSLLVCLCVCVRVMQSSSYRSICSCHFPCYHYFM